MRKVICLLAVMIAPVIWAKEAVPVAEDPVLEARMMKLASELRCLVCQNQTLADSHADLAEDFRREIRELMRQGKSDEEVVEFLVDRYGDFVRYRPPVKKSTLLLWYGPFALLALGLVVLAVTIVRRRRALGEQVQLTDEEVRRAEALLGGELGRSPGDRKA